MAWLQDITFGLTGTIGSYGSTWGATINNLTHDIQHWGGNVDGSGYALVNALIASPDYGAQVFNIKAYGAKVDGTTDDATSVQDAINACIAAGGGIVYFPYGNCLVGTYLDVYGPYVSLVGSGYGSVLLAKANAALGTVVTANNLAIGFQMRDLTVDGNRANVGTAAGASWNVNISSSKTTITRCQIQNGNLFGIFIGDNSVSPAGVNIDNCDIHHNGAATNPGANPNNGGGVYGGGTSLPSRVLVINSRLYNNYNTYGTIGACAAISFPFSRVTIDNCDFDDNFNVSGGFIYCGSSSVVTGWSITNCRGRLNTNLSGITSMVFIELLNVCDSVISGNQQLVAGAVTFPVGGIVLEASGAGSMCKNDVVSSNILDGLTNPALWTDSQSSGVINHITFANNTVTNSTVGLSVGNVGGSNDTDILDIGNDFAGCTTARINAISPPSQLHIAGGLNHIEMIDGSVATHTGNTTATVMKSRVLPANTLCAGMKLRVTASGVLTQASTQGVVSVQDTVQGVYCALPISSGGWSNIPWTITFEITIQSVGTTGAITYTMWGTLPNFSVNTLYLGNGSTTMNTTAAPTLQLVYTAGTGSDSLSVQQWCIEIL